YRVVNPATLQTGSFSTAPKSFYNADGRDYDIAWSPDLEFKFYANNADILAPAYTLAPAAFVSVKPAALQGLAALQGEQHYMSFFHYRSSSRGIATNAQNAVSDPGLHLENMVASFNVNFAASEGSNLVSAYLNFCLTASANCASDGIVWEFQSQDDSPIRQGVLNTSMR